jgi:hypothetical protein
MADVPPQNGIPILVLKVSLLGSARGVCCLRIHAKTQRGPECVLTILGAEERYFSSKEDGAGVYLALVHIGGSAVVRCTEMPAQTALFISSSLRYTLEEEIGCSGVVWRTFTFGPVDRQSSTTCVPLERLLTLSAARRAVEEWHIDGKPAERTILIVREFLETARMRTKGSCRLVETGKTEVRHAERSLSGQVELVEVRIVPVDPAPLELGEQKVADDLTAAPTTALPKEPATKKRRR